MFVLKPEIIVKLLRSSAEPSQADNIQVGRSDLGRRNTELYLTKDLFTGKNAYMVNS